MLKRWNILILVLVAMFAMALTACGGDDDGGGDASGSSTAAPSSSDGSSSTPKSSDDPDATPAGDEETPDGTADSSRSPTATGAAETTPADGSDGECGLLTDAEVAEEIGSPILESAGQVGGCSYTFEDLTSVAMSIADLGEDAEQIFELSLEFLNGEDVTGLGDRAFWVQDFNQLYVRDGSTQVFVTTQYAGDLPDAKATSISLAERILSRLDQ